MSPLTSSRWPADTRKTMPGRRRSLLAGLAALVLVAVPAIAHARAKPAPATVPRDLQALLVRSARLRIPYEIAQTSVVTNLGSGFGDTMSTTRERLSPPELATTSGSGPTASRLRLVDGTVYLQVPGLARVAHGRQWLRATPAQLGTSTAHLLGTTAAGLGQAAAITALLRDATSVVEVGPSVVTGEPVTEFLLTVDFGRLIGAGPSIGGGAQATVDVQLYLAADGLLKRQTINLDGAVVTTEDLLSDSVPVVVHAPRARDVVAYSAAAGARARDRRGAAVLARRLGRSGLHRPDDLASG